MFVDFSTCRSSTTVVLNDHKLDTYLALDATLFFPCVSLILWDNIPINSGDSALDRICR